MKLRIPSIVKSAAKKGGQKLFEQRGVDYYSKIGKISASKRTKEYYSLLGKKSAEARRKKKLAQEAEERRKKSPLTHINDFLIGE